MTMPERPALLVLASTYPRWPGDPEPGFVHELCRRLADRFAVTVVVPDAPGADASGQLDGVEVVRYRYAPRAWQTLVNDGGILANLRRARWKWLLLPGFVLGSLIAARRVARRRPIDVVHAHWLLPQGLVAALLRRPFVVTSHGADLYGLRGRTMLALKRRVVRRAAAMTVVSEAMADAVRSSGLHPSDLRVLPMGVDFAQRFVPADRPRDADRLLFVGRLVRKKGLIHLVDALPLIARERPSVRLDVAGFGPEREALEARARTLGVSGCIRFLGALPQDRLPELYQRASVFVAPFVREASGDQEGLPVALTEAIACACPVVAGRVAGLGDLLGPDAHGALVDAADPGRLAQAVLAILRAPADAEARAAAVRARVIRRMDWHRIADGYAEVLHAAARGGP